MCGLLCGDKFSVYLLSDQVCGHWIIQRTVVFTCCHCSDLHLRGKDGGRAVLLTLGVEAVYANEGKA